MIRREKVLLEVKTYTEKWTREELVNNQDIGITAEEVGRKLNVLRNNMSSDLNALSNSGEIIKINGRPKRFLHRSVLCEKISVKLIKKKQYNSVHEILLERTGDSSLDPFAKVIGYDKSLSNDIQLLEAAVMYPPHGLHTLMIGESGTGKSLLAEKMFLYGKQEGYFSLDSCFVVLNCADYANNPQLLLTQLFGSVKGAYTGAAQDRQGLIEKANNGILFLDEIHRLPPEGQEMLFHYIDKNEFSRLGDSGNLRKATTLLVGATTENPHSIFLETFQRRIPVLIHVPNLRERTLGERMALIDYLYNQESARINEMISVAGNVLRGLAAYFPNGNIGQIKSDIQISVARALLEKRNNAGENSEVFVDESYMPGYVFKGALTLTLEEKQKVNMLVDKECYQFSDSSDEKNVTNESYDFVNYYNENRDEPISKVFNDYSQNISKKLIVDENYSFFLNDDIKSIVLIISDYLYSELDLLIDRKIAFALALYIYNRTDFPGYLEDTSEIKTPIPSKIKNVTKKIIKDIEKRFDIYFNDNEINILADIINQFKSNKRIHNQADIVVCAHGDGIATGITDLVNNLLNISQVKAVDMSLNQEAAVIYDQLVQVIRASDCKDILLFVDMGSLTHFEKSLQDETKKRVIIIESNYSLLILEAAKDSYYMGMDTGDILRGIQNLIQTNYTKINQKVINSYQNQHKKIVYTVCLTGDGIARFLERSIRELLKKYKIYDVQVKAISGYNLKEIKKEIENQVNNPIKVLAIVGSIDPQINGISFISLQEIILKQGLNQLLYLLGMDVNQKENVQINVDFNRQVVLDTACEAIDKYLYYLSSEKIKDSVVKFIEKVEHEQNVWFENSTFMKLFIHTACMIERIAFNHNEINYPDKNPEQRKTAVVIKDSLSNIEKDFDIVIPIDECYFITDLLRTT
ncbi:MAG: sigma 54-interacting transcriptional regulator [Sporolactobacillus sp.]